MKQEDDVLQEEVVLSEVQISRDSEVSYDLHSLDFGSKSISIQEETEAVEFAAVDCYEFDAVVRKS